MYLFYKGNKGEEGEFCCTPQLSIGMSCCYSEDI